MTSKFPVQGDAEHVLFALRLGWGMAETRGRNRPAGPPGDTTRMPQGSTDALPLRVERTPTELRIEAQTVVATLAQDLRVNEGNDGTNFGEALDGKARLLYHMRAPRAARALQAALAALQPPAGQAASVEGAIAALQAGLTGQQYVIGEQQQAVTAALAALAATQKQATELAGQPDGDKAAAAAARAVTQATAALQLAQACSDGEAAGLQALTDAVTELQQANAASPDTTAAAGVATITALQQQLTNSAGKAWDDLAALIWRFDAHIQNLLAAQSETRAMGYQLGRGLAETYWALDRGQTQGATGWSFLLGSERCAELTRLTGRLGTYMNEYTAPAVAGSLEVWKAVAASAAWRGPDGSAASALYSQTRRWFELIVLGQDPTTLIKPTGFIRNWRAALRMLRFFWPQLVALVIGLAALVALIVYLSIGGDTVQKTLSGVFAAVGLTVASLTATLKNAGQAMFKRLRQDAYTDLVAIAVQTAPAPPRKSDLHKAIAQRDLTAATPN